MVEIKFCGMTRSSDARQAAEMGAAYVGMVFAESPRRVDVDVAREVAAAARASGARAVGVFGSASPAEIRDLALSAGLDVVQLHADAQADDARRLRELFPGEIWIAVRIGGSGLPPNTGAVFQAADAVLLDTHSKGSLGGTGERFDWKAVAVQIAPMRSTARLIVAGGLRAENVAAAIAALSPDIVDVSSGIEASPGIKDPARMRAFVDAVRGSTLVRHR
jgi:phosphoribosylanthranilate isomerase